MSTELSASLLADWMEALNRLVKHEEFELLDAYLRGLPTQNRNHDAATLRFLWATRDKLTEWVPARDRLVEAITKAGLNPDDYLRGLLK